jgi:hypothetical protein
VASQSGNGGYPPYNIEKTGDARAAALKKLIASCRGKGGRQDCKILAALSEDADGPR